MPRLQTTRFFLCQSAALAAGVYGSRAFSNTGAQNPANKTTGLSGGTSPADLSTAEIISAGLLGQLREVICWTDVRSPGADLPGGLRAFRNRGCQLLAGPLLALGLDSPATVPLEPGRVLQMGLRPEHLEAPAGITLQAEVDFVEMLGSTSYVHATLSTEETVIAERRSDQPRAGDRITLSFAPACVRLFAEDGQRVR